MPQNEKGQPEGRPIPNCVVYHDAPEFIASPFDLQVSALTRRCAISATMAEALAPLVYMGALR